ncbi:putative Virulence factor MviN-like protein [Bradyrhizobium sp. ORS 278]|uniref:murein biosynthesis integral membrane protein MurJ n=1 Tax=Bradyrhizobium sp. (strain ORS 278) TaxID=114615 RepID=UPI0001507EA2|nr:murein biosynthesis integral membrane protein MurJ [Bradyrhizobium sp. ORS 278]CAL74004.1 putative Virulence factor MviN-like protein [Bradyrhizobium sp. ORS 278]
MIRSFVTVLSGTLSSRLLGFGRDALIAALLGAGPVADAFLAAFQLVNVIRRLLTEGALNAALVPAWLRIYQSAGPNGAAAFAGRVLGTVSAGLCAASLALAVLMPFTMTVLAPGFSGDETLTMAVNDARLMLPYLAFAGPSTVLLALSSARGRFALAAFAPLLFNVALIAVTMVLLLQQPDPARAAVLLAATIGAAGLVQLMMLAQRGDRSRVASPVRISMDAAMRGFFARALPGMVASAGPQLLAVGAAIIASATPSAVSWLYFANRLIELPLGLVGVAMGTVLVPELTRALHAGNDAALSEVQSRGLELTMGLALPATLGLMILNAPIVGLLFEHGAFGADDAAATAQVLTWLAAALPAQVLTKALQPAFFAREDTTTPLRATLIGCGVAIALAFLLGQIFSASGIAAGLALGAWANAIVLLRRGAASFGFAISSATRRRLPRIALAAIVMAAALWVVAAGTVRVTVGSHAGTALLLAGLIGGAIILYAALLVALGVVDWRQSLRAIRQRSARDLPAGDLHV